MKPPEKGFRRPRLPGWIVDRVEETGRGALVGAWSLCMRVSRASVVWLSAALAFCWSWYRRQSASAQLVMAGLAGLLILSLTLRDGTPGPGSTPSAPPAEAVSDAEALARVIRSEIGVGTPQQKLHVAWATRNLARERGQSIARMACSPCGRQGSGRPVSTRQEATAADRELARMVLSAPQKLDPTGGATHFINPRLQDKLAKSGKLPGYKGKTYRRVKRRWRQVYGWRIYYRLGPELEFWGPGPERDKEPSLLVASSSRWGL